MDRISGISENQTTQAIHISPNPNDGLVTINASNEMDRISIVDLAGKVVFETDASGFETQLELSHLKSGVYLVKVASGSETSTERLIMK
jgi:hypothetical protein